MPGWSNVCFVHCIRHLTSVQPHANLISRFVGLMHNGHYQAQIGMAALCQI